MLHYSSHFLFRGKELSIKDNLSRPPALAKLGTDTDWVWTAVYSFVIVIVIVISRLLQRLQKRRHGNQLIHKRLIKEQRVKIERGRQSDRQTDRQMAKAGGVYRWNGEEETLKRIKWTVYPLESKRRLYLGYKDISRIYLHPDLGFWTWLISYGDCTGKVWRITALVWQCLTDCAPSYLSDLYMPVSDPASRRALRSSTGAELLVPRAHSAFKQRWVFSVICPSTLNGTPSYITLAAPQQCIFFIQTF